MIAGIPIYTLVPAGTKHPATWLIERARRAGVQSVSDLGLWLRARVVAVQTGGQR